MHTVVQNPHIRDLSEIPRYFTDVRTFSILPSNRVYRPIVTASLAVDYWLGGTLDPFYFQLSTFCWFLVQLAVMFALFRRICDLSYPDPRNAWVALAATAWYGLHPAMAETVNYIIQRADLYSTLGVAASLLLYACAPRLRRFGLYLVPVALGILSKPPALVFPAILFVYVWLFEDRPLRRCLFALVVTAALGGLTAAMTPSNFHAGAGSAYAYRITQPLISFRYFRTFFLPGGLTADTDQSVVQSIWQDGAWAGFLFVFALIAAAVWTSSRKQWRPVAFGLWWFLLALIPTSIFPLGEVENDHRMFFPFVGLVLAATWPVALWIYHQAEFRRPFALGLGLLCAGQFGVLALGTVQRNLVWRTEESLWRDVTVKSPRNARGLMNYATTLIQLGRAEEAIPHLERALAANPTNALVELNLGVAKGRLKEAKEAEAHFRNGIRLQPGDPVGPHLYAQWLHGQLRDDEALQQLQKAIALNPDFLASQYLLMQIEAKRKNWSAVQTAAAAVLARFPADADANAYRSMTAFEAGQTPQNIQPEEALNLSALYFETGEMARSIEAARLAIVLRPSYAEAYSNVAVASHALQDWDQAIESATKALEIRPGYRPAQRILQDATSKKSKTQGAR